MGTATDAGAQDLLDAARRGDETAYRPLVEPHRRELHAHCYRMLGSVHDAEDALQEALVRAWRGLPNVERQSALRAWLYRIATNTCLDEIARRPRRGLPVAHGPSADPHDGPGPPLAEAVWIEPYPDEMLGAEQGLAGPEARYEQRESLELAFVAALQHLPPNQRAALILREVLGFSAAEVAGALDTTVASVNSALQRARGTIEERTPERSQQATLRALDDARVRELVQAYTNALQRGDVEALIGMLTADAAWSMPPVAGWFRGHEAVAGFLSEYPLRERWRHLPTRANGQLAVGCYMWSDATERYDAAVLDVLTLRGEQIADVTGFLAPWVVERFGDAPELMSAAAFRRFGLPESAPG
jgi:RNA polymerase sigma-70 factor, ECF subfamily